MKITAEKLFDDLKSVKVGGTTCLFTTEKCQEMAPLMNHIMALKQEKNAILLAHSYVSPEILYISDFSGDSYELSKKAQHTTANTIVFSAVKFMAQTAKILNPTKTVLIPSRNNGCSLADSITADQVLALKQTHPNFTFVCYINTTAEVKALCDVCVTSSNCVQIIKDIPNQNIYFLPDKLMAQNIANQLLQDGIHKNIQWWNGTCYVHEDYDPEMLDYLKLEHPNATVLSHPECSPAILSKSDYVGSTSQMVSYVKERSQNTFIMLTECGLTAKLQMEVPGTKFVGSCTLCKYMKSNTLADIARVLENPEPQDIIEIAPKIIDNAKNCIEEMFRYAKV